MLSYRYPLIAREGWLWIASAFVTAGAVQVWFGLVALPLWALVLLLLFLFRDPSRKIPSVPLGVVSPVDGKVIAVDAVHDTYLDRQALCISIEMGFTSVYSAHSPMEGKVLEQWLGVPRKLPDTDEEVATYAQWIQSDEKDDVVLVIGASTRQPRPQCYAQSGERIGQGQRCGFIRFGAHVEVLLPVGSRIAVSAGDDVKAGSDILATLVHAKVTPPKAMRGAKG
jgi:phosphatidylserine decarboxylase